MVATVGLNELTMAAISHSSALVDLVDGEIGDQFLEEWLRVYLLGTKTTTEKECYYAKCYRPLEQYSNSENKVKTSHGISPQRYM